MARRRRLAERECAGGRARESGGAMTARVTAGLAAIAVVLIAGCSRGQAGEIGSWSEPLDPVQYLESPPEPGTTVYVAGALFDDEGASQICGVYLESYPPQCGSGVAVSALPQDVWDQTAQGVSWTGSFFTVKVEAISDTEVKFLELGEPAN